MPHITARFLAGGIGTENLREFLMLRKGCIRTIIAQALGYPLEEVAFYSSPEDPALTHNALPLEFVIDSGVLTVDREKECTEGIKTLLIQGCPGIETYHFGIWLRSHPRNEFVEHEPS